MKKLFLFCSVLFAAAAMMAAELQYSLTTRDAMPVYKCGEKAEFIFSVTQDGKPVKEGKYFLNITNGGMKLLDVVEADMAKANPVKFTATLKEPGFILVLANDANKKRIPDPIKRGTGQLSAGAGFEPEKIKMVYDLPEDFMDFWMANRKALADTPVELKEDPRSNKDYKVWQVTIKSLNDHTLNGFLSVPTGKGPFPAFVQVPPAGPGAVGPVTQYAREAITLVINVHRYPTATDWKEQAERHKKFSGNYPRAGSGSRNTYFYRAVYTGVDRAINYVAAMPEWDKKHMVTYGSSQGGGSALILAGLNKNITALAGNVPALCDHGGYKAGRKAGWPMLHGYQNADAWAPYFDAANFAKFIKVPALISCGFIDTTCHPASVYAAYNQIQSPKKMVHMPAMGHGSTPEFSREANAFVRKHLGLTK
ncbi:MAG: acetylxylan esterase [Lentisphaeria bacterium]|nr:acetylxylan esterase [Lentisphaeria bacterium]